MYGSSLVSFGGLFNRVTKKPLDAFKSEMGYTAGGYGLSRLTADVNAPLNKGKTLLFRMNVAKHNEGNFQDAGFKSYVFIAPVLTYKLSDKTSLTIDAEYRNEKANSFYRLFAGGSYTDGVRSLKDLKIDLAGYAYNNSKLVKTNPNTEGYRPTSAGPEHTPYWALRCCTISRVTALPVKWITLPMKPIG